MKFAFFGSPKFAAIILEKLIAAGFVPEAVVCNPDKPIGRKKIITAPPVKQRIMNYELGIRNKIQIFQPEKLNKEFLDPLLIIQPDIFIVAAYAKILPKEILEIPRFGAIGVHPSLLPKHRGPSPIQTAILNGDEITGATLYLMDERVDNGQIIAKREAQIANRNYSQLLEELANTGADLLIEILRRLSNNPRMKSNNTRISDIIELIPQNESQATYTKKFKIEDAFIKPQDLEKAQNGSASLPQVAIEIDRKIRALNPEPGTWTIQNKKRMKILEAILTPESKLKLKKIQFEGKKSIRPFA